MLFDSVCLLIVYCRHCRRGDVVWQLNNITLYRKVQQINLHRYVDVSLSENVVLTWMFLRV